MTHRKKVSARGGLGTTARARLGRHGCMLTASTLVYQSRCQQLGRSGDMRHELTRSVPWAGDIYLAMQCLCLCRVTGSGSCWARPHVAVTPASWPYPIHTGWYDPDLSLPPTRSLGNSLWGVSTSNCYNQQWFSFESICCCLVRSGLLGWFVGPGDCQPAWHTPWGRAQVIGNPAQIHPRWWSWLLGDGPQNCIRPQNWISSRHQQSEATVTTRLDLWCDGDAINSIVSSHMWNHYYCHW